MKKNYKVCVYAITKNEEKFVERWYNSMKEADKIVVLDTGSTDNTVKLLKELGIDVVVKNFKPWRFDTARNESLKLIPKDMDICVCTDLDEVFENGWKQKLINIWDKDITRVKYTYNWSFDEYGNPATTFLANKIHKNGCYKWVHPVHEVLLPLKEEKEIICPNIVLNHYPDQTKSRNSYLPLLELSVKEDPKDDRNMHYLGREYMYYGKWDKAINILKKHLKLESATWKDERSASMRFIARCYYNKGEINKSLYWYRKSILEAPYLREGYVEIANVYYEKGNYYKAYDYLKKAFNIVSKSNTYINEVFAWNSFIYDLLSVCAFNLGYYKEAYDNVQIAYLNDKNNERLKNNMLEMKKFLI